MYILPSIDGCHGSDVLLMFCFLAKILITLEGVSYLSPCFYLFIYLFIVLSVNILCVFLYDILRVFHFSIYIRWFILLGQGGWSSSKGAFTRFSPLYSDLKIENCCFYNLYGKAEHEAKLKAEQEAKLKADHEAKLKVINMYFY